MTARSTRLTAIQALAPSLAVAGALALAVWQLVSDDVPSHPTEAPRVAGPPVPASPRAVAKPLAAPVDRAPPAAQAPATQPARVVTVGSLRAQTGPRADPGRATSVRADPMPAWAVRPAQSTPNAVAMAGSTDPGLRARAATALATAVSGGDPGDASRALGSLVVDPVPGVRARAALALAATPGASDALVARFATEDDAQVRQALYGALARAGDEVALARLVAVVATSPTEAQPASEAARAIATRLGVPEPPGLLPSRSQAERRLARAQGEGRPGLPAPATPPPSGRRAARLQQAGWPPR